MFEELAACPMSTLRSFMSMPKARSVSVGGMWRQSLFRLMRFVIGGASPYLGATASAHFMGATQAAEGG